MIKKEKIESFGLKDIKCPVCGNPINTIWSLGEVVAGRFSVLAECWSGSSDEKVQEHLFVIHLSELPIVRLNPKSFKEAK